MIGQSEILFRLGLEDNVVIGGEWYFVRLNA